MYTALCVLRVSACQRITKHLLSLLLALTSHFLFSDSQKYNFKVLIQESSSPIRLSKKTVESLITCSLEVSVTILGSYYLIAKTLVTCWFFFLLVLGIFPSRIWTFGSLTSSASIMHAHTFHSLIFHYSYVVILVSSIFMVYVMTMETIFIAEPQSAL